MRLGPRSFLVLLSAALCLPSAARGTVQSKAPTNSSVLPVVLRGKDVPALIGVRLVKLSAFTCEAGKPKPIVFQIDEVNSDGWIVPNEGGSVARDEPAGVLDDNDELIFMLRDAGEPCGEEHLSRIQGKLFAITIDADFLKQPAVVYLLEGAQGFVPSQSYVALGGGIEVVSNAYAWGYKADPPFLYNVMRYADLMGRSKDDLLDQMKVRAEVQSLGSLVRLKFTERDVKASLEGMRVGPVRVTRQIRGSLTPVPGFTVPIRIFFYHYERLWHATVALEIPKAAELFVSSMNMAIIHDFIDLRGLRLSTSGLPQGTLIDGRMIEQERNILLDRNQPWFMVSGSGLLQMTIVHTDPALNLEPVAIFEDSAALSDPPEEVPGGLPAVGLQFRGWENLKAQWYTFGAHIALLPSFPEAGGNGFYRTLQAPLKVEVSAK